MRIAATLHILELKVRTTAGSDTDVDLEVDAIDLSGIDPAALAVLHEACRDKRALAITIYLDDETAD